MPHNMEFLIGPAAGVATSFLWTFTSLFFTAAGKRLGPVRVNGLRIALAIIFLGITHRCLTGNWIPHAQPGQVFYLALSGVIGLSLGDQALFTAFVFIGPRLSMLIMATSPIFAVLFGALVLGEILSGWALLGIALTLSGVFWVVLERPARAQQEPPARKGLGVFLALVGAACQAGGLLLSKQGIGHGWLPADEHIDPQTATFIRMCFAGLGVIPILAWYRFLRPQVLRADRIDRRRLLQGIGFTACGAVVGPFLGVWMSLVASDRAPLGIAQTLCSLVPVIILPFAVIVYKERLSLRAVLGALIAVGGSALLFLYPE